MSQFLGFSVAVAMLCLGIAAAEQAQKQAAPKKTVTTAKKKSVASSKKTAGKRTTTATTWRNRQAIPSPERYREIQTALASRGFLSPEEATGVWNQTSIDALKRFQIEQNIESTGKINSLSLIALGLGPKHEASTVPAPPAPGQ